MEYDWGMRNNSISPVKRSKAEARSNYNRLSRWYDGLAASEAKYRRMGVAALAVQPGESVLEIGFGTGGCLPDLAWQVGTAGFVCGIDLSDGMAAVARERLSAANLTDRVALTLGDAAYTPFGEGCFDAIFTSFTLELFDTPDITRVLGECQRILRPAGRLAVVALVKAAQPNLAERVYEWFHAKMPVAVDCRPILAQSALRETGFEIDRVISTKMWGLPVEVIVGRT